MSRQSDAIRFVTTAVMWAAATIIVLAVTITGSIDFIMLGIILGCTMLATAAVWNGGIERGSSQRTEAMHADDAAETEKMKRDERIERMLARLSAEEREELRARLTTSEGELTLDEMLHSQADARRRGAQ